MNTSNKKTILGCQFKSLTRKAMTCLVTRDTPWHWNLPFSTLPCYNMSVQVLFFLKLLLAGSLPIIIYEHTLHRINIRESQARSISFITLESTTVQEKQRKSQLMNTIINSTTRRTLLIVIIKGIYMASQAHKHITPIMHHTVLFLKMDLLLCACKDY